jgi:phage baseplate assembly protein W
MTYSVTAGAALTLNEMDPVASVLQNVAIILATRRGSCPMYRDFGISMDFLDRPMPVAKTLAYAEIKEAIETYEPRATVAGVTFSEDANTPGLLIPTVEVNIDAQ